MDMIQDVATDRETGSEKQGEFQQLSELQLALVGGGIADVIYG